MLNKKRCLEKIMEVIQDGYNGEVSELFYECFNSDEEYIYFQEAEKDLADYGTFDAIAKVVEYEQENLGGVHTNISNPCKVANMLFYILGEEVISNLTSFQNYQDEKMTFKTVKLFLSEIKSYL